MTIARSDSSAGFTLLEILVAITLFGLLLVGLGQGTRFGLQAWEQQAHALESRGDFDAIDRTLSTLMARLEPTEPVDGRADAIVFTTELPETASLPVRVADLELLVDGKRRLILRWVPHLHVNRLKPVPAPQEIVLLADVDRLELAYWRADNPRGWLRNWSNSNPPSLIRIRIMFSAGSRRHWPDIIAAPMRERPDH